LAKALADLVADARSRSGTVGNNFVTDTEIGIWVNQGIKQLYDLVIAVDPSYYTVAEGSDFTLSSSPTGNTHNLPADFYKERLLVIFPDTSREAPVFSLNVQERTRGKRGYTLDGNALRVWPWTSAGEGPYRLYYVPKAPQLSGATTLDVTLDNFDEYPSIYAARAIARKRRMEDMAALFAQDLGDVAQRVSAMASMRQGEPEQAPLLSRRNRSSFYDDEAF
jgi:hypothetical protein